MKKTIVILTLLSMTLTSFSKALELPLNEPAMSEKLARKIVAALRRNSSEEYVKLIPSLNEFHSLMDQNAGIYGATLPDAKADFSNQYNSNVIPSVRSAFDSMVADGKAKGINWNSVEIKSVEIINGQQGAEGSILIVLKSDDKEFKLQFDQVFLFENEWRAGTEFRFM